MEDFNPCQMVEAAAAGMSTATIAGTVSGAIVGTGALVGIGVLAYSYKKKYVFTNFFQNFLLYKLMVLDSNLEIVYSK